MKIYFSEFFKDYIFLIGGQPYFFFRSDVYPDALSMVPVWPQHLKDRYRKNGKKKKEDCAVTYICKVKD